MSETLTRSYPVGRDHDLPDSPLEAAIAAFEGAATRFALDAISDAKVRESYMSNIRRMSQEVRLEVDAGRMSAKEGLEYCYEMRNKIMAEHRKFTSAQALAKAEKHKLAPPTLGELLDKYADKEFGKKYAELTPDQKSKISYKIIESSGRDNAKVSKGTARLKVIGKVGILVTAALATYEVINAENKKKEAARQGIILGGGAAGGAVAGLGVSLFCGPGAPLCAIAVVLVGSALGGIAGSLTADALDDELEELSHWEIF